MAYRAEIVGTETDTGSLSDDETNLVNDEVVRPLAIVAGPLADLVDVPATSNIGASDKITTFKVLSTCSLRAMSFLSFVRSIISSARHWRSRRDLG